MRRWNGWGEEGVVFPLSAKARVLLQEQLGPGTPPRDATLEEILSRVPPSRLPPHPLVSPDPEERLRHARGQSLPDWIFLRSGQVPAFPDGVAFPTTNEEVRALLVYAREVGARVIPYGGGTSVAGQVSVLPGEAPVLSLDLRRMNRLLRLDEKNLLAIFEAGVQGPDLEAQLRARGFTLGHFPQSFPYSTLGGWVATRSVGQESLRYGRIEDLFAGGRLEAPVGTLLLPPFPGSAAGPDLRQVVLGSEGRLGVLTEVTVRIRPLPQAEAFAAVFFREFGEGLEAVRRMAQEEVPLSLVRLSTPEETGVSLALTGQSRGLALLEAWLAFRGVRAGRALLLLGASGTRAKVSRVLREALGIARAHGGVYVGQAPGRFWAHHRFRQPYLRNTLWEMGYAVDTLETAGTWSQVPRLLLAVEAVLREALGEEGERVYAFSHLSRVYATGANLYTTYLFRLHRDPEVNLARWRKLKAAASQAIVAHGGTISHQHGVGTDHLPYLEAEKGPWGLEALQALCRTLDPWGLMNPGKLV